MKVKIMTERVFYIQESLGQSLARDLGTFSAVGGVIGLGWWLQSPAMQWFGFVLISLWFMGRIKGVYEKTRVSPQEAANRLLVDYGVTADLSRSDSDNMEDAMKSEWKTTTITNPDFSCKCGGKDILHRVHESSCGGYEDTQYSCRSCGHSWWVGSADA
jgi:DNA-directed RNA polymerase subunit M/transcription elongation factor TFIIS